MGQRTYYNIYGALILSILPRKCQCMNSLNQILSSDVCQALRLLLYIDFLISSSQEDAELLPLSPFYS